MLSRLTLGKVSTWTMPLFVCYGVSLARDVVVPMAPKLTLSLKLNYFLWTMMVLCGAKCL